MVFWWWLVVSLWCLMVSSRAMLRVVRGEGVDRASDADREPGAVQEAREAGRREGGFETGFDGDHSLGFSLDREVLPGDGRPSDDAHISESRYGAPGFVAAAEDGPD